MAFDSLLQRRIMGRFATGVTIITARCDDRLWGMTANSILSLSLDPPLILVSVDRRNQMHACMSEGKCFAVNVLTAEQEDISRRFATRGPKDFEGVAITTAATGAPILMDALAFVDCLLVQVLPGGDHDIFVGEAVAGEARQGEPLIFYAGKYTQLSPTPLPEDVPSVYYSLEDLYEHFGSF